MQPACRKSPGSTAARRGRGLVAHAVPQSSWHSPTSPCIPRCRKGRDQQMGKLTHRIHVWSIFLHLGSLGGKCRYILSNCKYTIHGGYGLRKFATVKRAYTFNINFNSSSRKSHLPSFTYNYLYSPSNHSLPKFKYGFSGC